jgi:hypothetical protein
VAWAGVEGREEVLDRGGYGAWTPTSEERGEPALKDFYV